MLPARNSRSFVSLSLRTPVREVRLFARGVNTSTQGPWLFDDAAAKSVMSHYRRHGSEVMIDYEHLSLDADCPNYDPRAVGWCNLELRNGELYATNIRWTARGKQLVENREARFFSPTFTHDKEGRAVRLINIALTALPATDGIQALIAASQRKTLSMNKETVQRALEALAAGETEELKAILEALIVEEISGESDDSGETPSDDPGSDEPLNSLAEEPIDESDEEEDKAVSALLSAVGAKSIAELKSWRDAALKQRATLSQLEADTRAKLVGELISLRAETPHTAYREGKLCKRLAQESVASLRSRVDALRGAAPARVSPKRESESNVVTLSQDAERKAKARGIPVEVVLERKAAMLSHLKNRGK